MFLGVPWRLLLWGLLGLMAVVGSSLIFLFVPPLWLRWSAKVTQPVRVSLLWPASWASAVDKTRNSRSAEVREIWDLYDKCLQFLPVGDALAFGDALAGRDVHLAWRAWSTAAENALARAFGMAGSPIPPNGLVLSREAAKFWVDNIGGKRVRRFRPDLDDPASASEVHLYRCCSVAPLLTPKRRLRAVASLLRSVARNGFTLSRALDLDNQWSCIIGNGPVGILDWEHLVGGSKAGLGEFGDRVDASMDRITEFVLQMVVHRRDFGLGMEELGSGGSACTPV